MRAFLSRAGAGAFLIVFALNLAAGNSPAHGLVKGLVAALAFAFLTRWFMRKAYTQVPMAALERQVKAHQAKHAPEHAAHAPAAHEPPAAAAA